MQINNVYFLPGDDPAGWTVTSTINNNDASRFGAFSTVTLRGKKAGQLDFEYQLSVSKQTTDIIVSLSRTNNTGKPVEIGDMDYFVSGDARLGGTVEGWISLGTHSRNRDEYELWPREIRVSSGGPIRRPHLQHRGKAGPPGSDFYQPAHPADGVRHQEQIGRASGRERGENSVVA